jgi:hypothetical protein
VTIIRPSDADRDRNNFLEFMSVEDANAVDMSVWKFIGFSESRGYMFGRRMRRE